MMTIVTSHEIREIATNPADSPNYSWYDASGYEADDKSPVPTVEVGQLQENVGSARVVECPKRLRRTWPLCRHWVLVSSLCCCLITSLHLTYLQLRVCFF